MLFDSMDGPKDANGNEHLLPSEIMAISDETRFVQPREPDAGESSGDVRRDKQLGLDSSDSREDDGVIVLWIVGWVQVP